MANFEIIGEKLQCYLYIYINNNVYCLDKSNSVLVLDLPQDIYDIIIIGTKTQKYNMEDTLKSMSFKIKPTLLQAYKDKGFLNHIFGWNNKTYFFIKKISVKIREKSKINICVKNSYIFTYFESKEAIKDIDIISNSKVSILLSKNYNFVNKKQKQKYYTVQFLLLFIKYLINIVFTILFLLSMHYYVIHPEESLKMTYTYFDLVVFGVFIPVFTIRFIIYSVRICRILKNNSDVLIT